MMKVHGVVKISTPWVSDKNLRLLELKQSISTAILMALVYINVAVLYNSLQVVGITKSILFYTLSVKIVFVIKRRHLLNGTELNGLIFKTSNQLTLK